MSIWLVFVLLFALQHYRFSKELKSELKKWEISEEFVERSEKSFSKETKYVIGIIVLSVMILTVYYFFILE